LHAALNPANEQTRCTSSRAAMAAASFRRTLDDHNNAVNKYQRK
jgi:hypothetical protein